MARTNGGDYRVLSECQGFSTCQEGPVCPLAVQGVPPPWGEHLGCECSTRESKTRQAKGPEAFSCMVV